MTGKKDFLASTLYRSGLNRLLRSVGSWHGLVTVNYHRVGNPRGSYFDRGVWSCTTAEFEKQIRDLKRNTDLIGIKDLDDAMRDPNGRYSIITFDDGYIDNYEDAFPILKSLDAPATFFLTTGFLDEGNVAWWDDIAWMVRASLRKKLPTSPWTSEIVFDEPHRNVAINELLKTFKVLPWNETRDFLTFIATASGTGRCPHPEVDGLWMNWDMVREMRQAGMDIGGHTVGHPILARLSAEEQWCEISVSKARIEAELGETISAFSYPVGQPDCFDETTKLLLKQAGYDWGFSFYGHYARPGHVDHFDVPRVPVDPYLSRNRFRGLLTLPQLFATS